MISAATASPTLSLHIRAPEALEVLAALRSGIKELQGQVAALGPNFTAGTTAGIARLEGQVNELTAALATSKLELSQIQQRLETTSAAGIKAQQAEQQAIVTKNRIAREESKKTAEAEEESQLRKLTAAETALARLSRLQVTSVAPNTKQRLSGESILDLENQLGANRSAASQVAAEQAQQIALRRMAEADYVRAHAEATAENAEIDRAAAARRAAEQSQQLALHRMSESDYSRAHAEAVAENAAIDRAAAERRTIEQARQVEIQRLNEAAYVRAHAEAAAENAAIDKAAAERRAIEQARDLELYKLAAAEKLRTERENAARIAAAGAGGAAGGGAGGGVAGFARGLARGGGASNALTYGSTAPIVAGFALAATLAEAIKAGSEFQYQMEFTRSIINETAQNASDAGEKFKKLAIDSQFSATEIAKGSRVLGQAGFDSFRDIVATLPTVLKLAAVGELDVASAAEIAAGNMNAFGLSVNEIPNIANSLAKAAVISQTNIKEMGEALKQVGPIAQQAGVNINDMNAMLAILATRNIRGSQAGTSLANVIRELIAPSDKGRDALRRIGVDAIDPLTGKMKGAVPLMKEFLSVFRQFDPQSQTVLTSEIFNNRASKGFITELAEATTRLPEFQTEITKAYTEVAFLDTVMEKLSQTFRFQAKEALNALQVAFIDAFEGSSAQLTDFARSLKTVFSSDEFRSGLATLLSTLAQVLQFLVEHGKAIVTIIELYAAWKIATLAVETAIAVYARLEKGVLAVALAMRTLGAGPVGIALALAGAASAWFAFGDAAETAVDKAARASAASSKQIVADTQAQIDKLRERNEFMRAGAESDAALRKIDEQLADVNKRLKVKQADEQVTRGSSPSDTIEEAAHNAEVHTEIQKQLNELYKERAGLEELRKNFLAQLATPVVTAPVNKLPSGSLKFDLPSKTIGAEKTDILAEYRERTRVIEDVARQRKIITDKYRAADMLSEEQYQDIILNIEDDRINQQLIITSRGLDRLEKLEYVASGKIAGLKTDAMRANTRAVEAQANGDINAEQKRADASVAIAKAEEENANQIRIRTAQKELVARQQELQSAAIFQTQIAQVEKAGREKRLNDQQLAAIYKLHSDAVETRSKKQQQFDISLMPEYQALQMKEQLGIAEQFYPRIRDIQTEIAKTQRELGPGQSFKLGSLKAELAVVQQLMLTEQAETAAQTRANYEKGRQASTGIKLALQNYRDSATNDAANYGQAITSIFRSAEEAMTNFFMTGKLGWRDFATFAIRELVRIQSAKLLAGVASSAVSLFFPSAPAAAGAGATSYGPTAGVVKTNHTGGIVGLEHTALRTLAKFHSGGIVGDEQLVIAKKKEGIFTPAQMRALAPVDRVPAAKPMVVAPSINSSFVINIEVNNNGDKTDASSSGTKPGALADGIRAVVQDELVRQSRPGGALSRSRA